MKILNDIAWNLNSNKFNSNSIEVNSTIGLKAILNMGPRNKVQ
jgi:hypothetical protein